MDFKCLHPKLEKFGIWRCKFVEYSFDSGKIGIIEMYVPKTTNKTKIHDFIYDYAPAACTVQIKEMKNPLKYRKYTYFHEIKY